MKELPRLSQEQREFFDRNGFLVVENALPMEMLERLSRVTDRLADRIRREQNKGPHDKVDRRNIVVEDELFLELVDWPITVPLVYDIFGWNVGLITSHLIVLPPAAPGSDPTVYSNSFHRDGGTSPAEMSEPHPRLFLKIAYFLTDTTMANSGALQVIPGSNRLVGPPPVLENGRPHGAIEVGVKPGTAVFFEQRTWHGVGQNLSGVTRKSLYYGYGYRWIRPMDYTQTPPEVLARCNPVQRQLLGEIKTPLGYYLPKDEDVPLRNLLKEREAAE